MPDIKLVLWMGCGPNKRRVCLQLTGHPVWPEKCAAGLCERPPPWRLHPGWRGPGPCASLGPSHSWGPNLSGSRFLGIWKEASEEHLNTLLLEWLCLAFWHSTFRSESLFWVVALPPNDTLLTLGADCLLGKSVVGLVVGEGQSVGN